jgi:hypothetical protein
MEREGLIRPPYRTLLRVETSVDALLDGLSQPLPRSRPPLLGPEET